MATVNVTIGMTPEMLAEIDKEAENLGISRAEYVRRATREAATTPLNAADGTLSELTQREEAST